jgi:GT2 family glycosyltransferase
MMPDLTVIIVNYNAGDELRQALRSVADACADIEWEAIVVDNASTDGSAAAVPGFVPHARLLQNAANVGFGRAVNQATAASSAPQILLMNPDCQLTPAALSTLRAALEEEPSCAVAGPRILDPDGSVQGSARGDPDMLTGMFGRTGALRALLPSLPTAKRNVVVDEAIAAGAPRVVDWVSGACMLIRRSALEAVGGFDERYFLYWEDADLCRRLRQQGYHVRYVPAAVAVHTVGRSSRTAPHASVRAFHDSAYRYYATHVAPGALDPRRPVARMLLRARCWLKLRASDPIR